MPTPVGNLEDITLRAIRLLKEADFVMAEDTRTSGILLNHYEIKNRMIPFHKFNEHQQVAHYVEMIAAAKSAVLISDAGTPGISDPGFCFEGFLPQKKGRQKRIEALRDEERTMIFYESPYRLIKALEQFGAIFGTERMVCVSREISKLHEENYRGSIAEAIAHFTETGVKGEIVIVVEGAKNTDRMHDDNEN